MAECYCAESHSQPVFSMDTYDSRNFPRIFAEADGFLNQFLLNQVEQPGNKTKLTLPQKIFLYYVIDTSSVSNSIILTI